MFARKVLTLLSVVLFALCLVVPVTAQVFIPPGATDTGLGGQNAITGMILSSAGGRLERRVSIRLRTMTTGDRMTMSDENGAFSFRGLPSGDYTIVIDKEKDFEPFTQVVTVIQARGYPGQTYNVSVRLTPTPGSTGKPGVINADLVNVPKPALDLFNKGMELAKNRDLTGAVEQLQNAVAEYPKFMLAYNELGVQYMKLNELEKADEALKKALEIDPKSFMPLMNRGIVLVMLKRYSDAEPLLREAVKMKSDQAVSHYFLGQAVAYQGNFDEAEKELSTAIKLGGDEMKEAHRLLAIVESARGNKKRAATELETYLRLVPNTPDAEQLRNAIAKFKGQDAATPASTTKPSP